MSNQEKIEQLMSSMSEEELRARAEAAELGQLKIMQSAIAALISVSLEPDYIQLVLVQAMAEMNHAEPGHPAVDWAPAAIAAGAAPVVEYFSHACQANRDRFKGA